MSNKAVRSILILFFSLCVALCIVGCLPNHRSGMVSGIGTGIAPDPPGPEEWVRGPIEGLPQWVLLRDAEAAAPSFSRAGLELWRPMAAAQWRHLRGRLRPLPPRLQAEAVNTFFNGWPHRDDLEVWGVEEYWARPVDFINRGGDCEDYAIVKYYALRDLGFEAAELRIAAVWNPAASEPHALLLARAAGQWLVLDNLEREVTEAARLDRYRHWYYAVNEAWMWRPSRPAPSPADLRKTGAIGEGRGRLNLP